MWFDDIGYFLEGFARVRLGSKYNFINTDGNFLREDLWFDYTWNFQEGFALVQLNDKGWNYINADGKILRDDLWFDWAYDFYNGFAKVILGDKNHYIDTKGNLYDNDKKLINKVNENRQRVVRLTESKLRNTIKSVVAQYLNESRRR